MVRGRTGGGGAAFNLGEMTVTRCTVRTDAGFVGHAYVAGRDERQAEMAALADALLQDPVAPVAAACHADRTARRRATGRTRCDGGEGGGDARAVLCHAEHARMSAGISLPGFADPVRDAQTTFRAVLDAMARPGRLHHAGQNLNRAGAARSCHGCSAVDADSTTRRRSGWTLPPLPARGWLAFHCGAAIVDATRRGDVRACPVAAEFRGTAGRHARDAREFRDTDPAGSRSGRRRALSPVGSRIARARAAGGERSAGGFRRASGARTTHCIRAGSTSCCAPIPS